MLIVQEVSVAVTVGQLATLRTRMDITGAAAGWIGTLVRLSVSVRHDGQRFTRGTGHMRCRLGGTARTYPVVMDTVLPRGGAALQVNGIGMHAGSWRCAVKIKDSGGRTDTWTGPVSVPGGAAARRISASDYVVPPANSVPAWAIALMVLGGLILFSIWALILRRNRRHPAST